MKLSENICRLRTEKRMSQDELAQALNVSRQSVSKWETGSSVPDLDKLMKLSQLFQISLDELTGNPQTAVPPANTPQAEPTPELQTVYVPVPAQSGMTPMKYLGGVLLVCSFLMMILASDSPTSFMLLMALPFAVCGILCFTSKHPGFFCCWVGCISYWIYFFVLTPRWEEQAFLLVLGVVLVIGMIVCTIRQQQKGIVRIPAWVWIIGTIVLSLLAFLLLLNTVPPFWITSSTTPVG